MYSASGAGIYLPTGDPTLTPRWLLMMAGGLFIGGLGVHFFWHWCPPGSISAG